MHIASIVPARLIKQAFDLVQDSVTTYRSSTNAQAQQATYTQMMQGLWLYGGLLLFMASLRALFSFLARQSIMLMGKRIEYALRNEIYSHYQGLPLAFYSQHRTGDLMARISEDINQVSLYLGPAIAFGLNAAITFLLIIPCMCWIDVPLTLYVTVPILVLAIGICYFSTFMHQPAEAIQHRLSTLTAFAQESFSGMRIVQAFVREKAFAHDFCQACEDYKQHALTLAGQKALFFPAVQACIGGGIVVAVWLGGQAVLCGKSTIGQVAAFVMYLQLLGWPTFSISWVTYFVQRAAASQKRINELLQAHNPITSQKEVKTPLKGHIAFKQVSFTYPGAGIQALQDVTFEVAAGQTVAILGPTSAGKTTLARLLVRLYDPEAGTITIDGRPIQDYAVSHLRQQIGYVPQDVFLFSDTIQNNMAWGQPAASPAQLAKATRLAAIDETIQQLPEQMNTKIGEKGVRLSGGQKQRVTLARALVHDPPILLLDDCLSAIDTETEQRIIQAMQTQLQDRTALIISHRLAVAQLADQIIVLEAGKVVEQGTHASLWARQGLYYTLYRQQQKLVT